MANSMEEPRDDPIHVDPLPGDLPAENISGDLPDEPLSGDLPARSPSGGLPVGSLSGGLPAGSLSGGLPAEALSNDLPAESLSRDLAASTLPRDLTGSPLSKDRPDNLPSKDIAASPLSRDLAASPLSTDLPDEPPSKDTITGDSDSATITIGGEINGESTLSTETNSSIFGSKKTTPSQEVLVDDHARQSKDTGTSTEFLSERPSGTSDETIDMDVSPEISMMRMSNHDVSLAPTPSHERREADELKDFRSQLFYKHDKLCLCVNGRDWDHIPEVIFELDDLRCLFVANNYLKELPNGISNLKNLEVSERLVVNNHNSRTHSLSDNNQCSILPVVASQNETYDAGDVFSISFGKACRKQCVYK